MRVFLTVLAMCLCFASTVSAMLPITEGNIRDAQTFAKKNKDVAPKILLDRWTIKDRIRKNVYANGEHIIVYTPYLVAVIDAQTKCRGNQVPKVADGMSLAQQYKGILAVGTIIDSNEKLEPKMVQIFITQGKKILAPYSVSLDAATERQVKLAVAPGAAAPVRVAALNEVNMDTVDKKKLSQVKKEVEEKTKTVLQSTEPAAAPVTQAAAPVATIAVPTIAAPAVPAAPIVKPVKSVWNLQYFVYFDLSELNIEQPFVMTVSDKAGGIREFPINLRAMN